MVIGTHANPRLLLNAIPFFTLLVVWFVAFFYIRKRDQQNLQREIDELTALQTDPRPYESRSLLEYDLHVRHHLGRLAVQQRRFVHVELRGIHGSGCQQRMAADHSNVFHMAIRADADLQFHSALHVRCFGQGRVKWRR